jgi:hypothetical protein
VRILFTPRGLGFAIATTSAAFLPHLEQRIGWASSFRVTFQPTRRARASGSISRTAPHPQVTRTKDCQKQSSSFTRLLSHAGAGGSEPDSLQLKGGVPPDPVNE